MLLVGNGRLITRDEAFPYAEDGAARVITKEMSVRDMHAFAKRIRKAGAAVFFAEMA